MGRRLAWCAIGYALALCAAGQGWAGQASEPQYGLATWHQVITCNPGDPSAGEEVYTCTFAAPARCRIISATATPIGGPVAESLAVTVAPDGTKVTSVITAQPRGAAADRPPAHPQVSITAKLKCSEPE